MEAFKMILLTAAVCVRGASQDNVDKTLQPKLSIESKLKSFYPTEKVTLKCSVDGDSNRWTYEWFRDAVQLPKDEDISLSRNTLSINSAKVSHSGVYTCKGKHLSRMEMPTSPSKKVELRIYGAMPKLQIKKRQWFKPFYTGEKIQISCERIGVGWEYKWYRIKESIKTVIKDAKPTFKINSASLSDTGGYLCKAKRGNLSVESETLQMEVQQLPLPHIQSEWTEAFPGEKVSMQCVLHNTSENWIYSWFRGSIEIVPNNVTSIKVNTLTLLVQSNHNGEYECQAELKGRMVKTAKSKTQSLTVHASQPTILLKQDPAYPELYTGEQVKLHCSIQEQMFQWEYLWQKDSGGKKVQVNSDFKNPVYTVSSTVYSDNGSYTCQVKTRGVTFTSTEFINLVIREPPQPKLSIESEWKSFYRTEKVTLKCLVDGDSNEWGYEWLRDAVQLPNDESISLSGNTLSISSASISHSGVYSCKGKHLTRTPVTTAESENMQLRVDGVMPKPSLEKHEWFKPFYIGEKIQLDCSMAGVGWEYSWYKVKGSKQTEQINQHPACTINLESVSDNGLYLCKATRGNYSVDSETLEVQVQKQPEPHVQSEWTEAFPGEKVSMQCVLHNTSENWIYLWFRNSIEIASSEETNIKGNTLTFSVQSNHNEDYECQAELKGRMVKTGKSKTQSLTVYALPVAVLTLETDLSDIMKGEITLRCNISDGRQWNYTWYKNEMMLNASSETLTVKGTEEAIKCEFKCKGVRTEIPLFSATSEGYVANNLMFRRKVLLSISGILICFIVIMIIGCIILISKYKRPSQSYRVVAKRETEDWYSQRQTQQTRRLYS